MSWLRSVWSARRGICIASKAVRTATALGKFCLVLWFVAYFAEIVPQSRVFADYTQLLGPALLPRRTRTIDEIDNRWQSITIDDNRYQLID